MPKVNWQYKTEKYANVPPLFPQSAKNEKKRLLLFWIIRVVHTRDQTHLMAEGRD